MATRQTQRFIATALVGCLCLPVFGLAAGCGKSEPAQVTPEAPPPAQTQQKGMSSTQKKVVLLAGAALLYYLWKKNQARKAESASANSPQLYRSKNGGIYYRDANQKPVWVTAPAQGIAVPADQVQRYAPDYESYSNQPAPPAPSGYRSQPATEFDPDLAGAGVGGPPGPRGR